MFLPFWHLHVHRIWRLTTLDQPKSAIVFSNNERELAYSYLPHGEVHGLVGVVVSSIGILCHACVLCSSTSAGRQNF